MEVDSIALRTEKRNRPPISCEPCRSRKLKCNRNLPCESCVRRGKTMSCTYASNAIRGGSKAGKKTKPRDLNDRLASLESLVSSFLSQSSGAPTQLSTSLHSVNEAAVVTPDLGSTVEHLRRAAISIEAMADDVPDARQRADNHIDPSHWLSILDDIKEVREHLASTVVESASPSTQPSTNENPDYSSRDTGGSDPSLVLGAGHTPSTLGEIIARLPARSVCDMLLSWYFNSQFMVLGVVHPAKFQSEYEQFWASPATTSPLWIALLFAILSITCCRRQISGLAWGDGEMPTVETLQWSTLQCLVLGRYATAKAHALEAFVLHLQSTFMSHNIACASSARIVGNDNNTALTEAWFLMGTIIRLALRLGYHREEKNASSSPFDAEMRRRVWLNVFQIDALLSFQIGLPSMIPQDACTTTVPRNLEYSDLAPDMDMLPPSRPLTQYTPMLYTIVKASVMAVFKKITTFVMVREGVGSDARESALSEQTRALDVEMRSAYAQVPEIMRARDVGRSGIMDNACLICQRATIEILHLKGLVVLHRRYVTYHADGGGSSSSHNVFRQACVSAALAILARQADLHSACSSGGRLYEDRWIAMVSVPISDYLLAAMVVCLDLSVHLRGADDDRDGGLRVREYGALQTSQRIYAASSWASPDAKVASQVLTLMVRKVVESDAKGSGRNEPEMLLCDPPELSYALPMSLMIDGSESIDWVSFCSSSSAGHSNRTATNFECLNAGPARSIPPEHRPVCPGSAA
ncbi:fungal-specific transcription factor domain-domain-containing protein [Microdochium bolleyi]|uniref:Fungal-specific transcription factor domain-domain-containing protein n=1 Tax=Microdochium bolleyi TaxID=196109 RepID=A0A136IM88_9PEZI|nr:fungal-specific transcription factor domain-domain-containing protein [Microdochium bolleyi]